MAVKQLEANNQSATCPTKGKPGHKPLDTPTASAPIPNQMIVNEGIINSSPIKQKPAIIQHHHSTCIYNLAIGSISPVIIP
jgi:hypothetical protein